MIFQKVIHVKNVKIRKLIGCVRNVIGIVLKDMLVRNVEENNDYWV